MPGLSKYANSWRTTGDIRDTWASMSAKGFSQDKWAGFSGHGHWNDPDMLVVGRVGWGSPHLTHLTPNEQYTHISIWCLLSAPLLIGCDLGNVDDFTIGVLSNDEVLALDQDALGKQATCIATNGFVRIYAKNLEDGSKQQRDCLTSILTAWTRRCIGPTSISTANAWCAISGGKRTLAGSEEHFEATAVPPHGVVLVRLDKRSK